MSPGKAGVWGGCPELGVSPTLRMGSMPQGRFLVALLLQEAFLGSWYSTVPLGPRRLSVRPGQVLGGVRERRGQVSAPAPSPSSSWSHLTERQGPCEHQRARAAWWDTHAWGPHWAVLSLSGASGLTSGMSRQVPRMGLSPPYA